MDHTSNQSQGTLVLQVVFALSFLVCFAIVAVPYLVPDLGVAEYEFAFTEIPPLAGVVLSLASMLI